MSRHRAQIRGLSDTLSGQAGKAGKEQSLTSAR